MVEKPGRDQFIKIAETFGTPVYVYHAEKIKGQYERLKNAFTPGRLRIFYASKALTNIKVLQYVKSLGSNVDCSSIYEAKLAKLAGFEPSQILYTSNGIHFDEIVEAQQMGIHINIDSLSNLEKFAKKFGNSYPVGIRLRPNIMAGGNLKISTGHEKSKFGISVLQIEEIKELVNKYNLNVQTLHIHTGSEIKEVSVFLKGINILFDLIPFFKNLKALDIGGGMKVPYKKDDVQTDIESLGKEVMQAMNDYNKKNNTDIEIWLEPGKFMVSEAGYFITQVNVLKQTAAAKFASVNSGFNHLIRPMFYDAYHHIENLSNPEGELENYVVCGNICETDNFAWDRPIAEVKEGDYLLFHNAGAYGFEMSSNFNSRLKPPEVMLVNKEAILIRRREVFEDLLTTQNL